MALHLDDKWVWDFWLARDGDVFHIFYLQAPRAVGNPDLRHWHSSIGHAVSQDLRDWKILPDALGPSKDEDAWDSLTTWTGCALRHHHTWYMYYTGTKRAEAGLIQRIGLATSQDLVTWTKYDANPIINIDPRWYELLDKDIWYEETWRDPWVFEYNGKFHALITARAKQGLIKERGVIGYACSHDLLQWDVKEPITAPGTFAYLEVPQLVNINQRWYVVFCVEQDKYAERRLARQDEKPITGTHYLIGEHPLGPYTYPEQDVLYGDELGSLYSGKLIQDNSGKWVFMAAIQFDTSKQYVGDISDPIPVLIKENGQIIVSLEKYEHKYG